MVVDRSDWRAMVRDVIDSGMASTSPLTVDEMSSEVDRIPTASRTMPMVTTRRGP